MPIEVSTKAFTVRIVGKPDREKAEKALKDFVQACNRKEVEKKIGRSA